MLFASDLQSKDPTGRKGSFMTTEPKDIVHGSYQRVRVIGRLRVASRDRAGFTVNPIPSKFHSDYSNSGFNGAIVAGILAVVPWPTTKAHCGGQIDRSAPKCGSCQSYGMARET